MVEKNFPGISDKAFKKCSRFFGGSKRQHRTGDGFCHISISPAAYYPVKGKDEESAEHAHIADANPGRIGFELVESTDRIEVGFSAQGELGQHDGGADHENADQIDEHKRATAVFPHYIRKLPDIAESDRRPGGGQDEPQATAPEPALIIAFSLHGMESIYKLGFESRWNLFIALPFQQ